jgi:hypothetical protein
VNKCSKPDRKGELSLYAQAQFREYCGSPVARLRAAILGDVCGGLQNIKRLPRRQLLDLLLWYIDYDFELIGYLCLRHTALRWTSKLIACRLNLGIHWILCQVDTYSD